MARLSLTVQSRLRFGHFNLLRGCVSVGGTDCVGPSVTVRLAAPMVHGWWRVARAAQLDSTTATTPHSASLPTQYRRTCTAKSIQSTTLVHARDEARTASFSARETLCTQGGIAEHRTFCIQIFVSVACACVRGHQVTCTYYKWYESTAPT